MVNVRGIYEVIKMKMKMTFWEKLLIIVLLLLVFTLILHFSGFFESEDEKKIKEINENPNKYVGKEVTITGGAGGLRYSGGGGYYYSTDFSLSRGSQTIQVYYLTPPITTSAPDISGWVRVRGTVGIKDGTPIIVAEEVEEVENPEPLLSFSSFIISILLITAIILTIVSGVRRQKKRGKVFPEDDRKTSTNTTTATVAIGGNATDSTAPQTIQVQCMHCGQINTIIPGQDSFVCIKCGVKSVKK